MTIPPGWSRDPSSRAKRVVLAGLALAGFLIAAYLALFQLELISTVWEPFFGDGSRTILDSSLSRALPLPDAAVGAAVYLIDALLALIGGDGRWRTRPWLVLANGAVSVALGLTGIILLIVQPVGYGAYCSLCMLTAFLSINLMGPSLEEVLAALQHLAHRYTRSTPSPELKADARSSSPAASEPESWRRQGGIAVRSLLAAAIGGWLMAAPALLNYAGDARGTDRLVGPVVLALGILAIWPATRWFGRIYAIAGAWLLIGPVVLVAPLIVVAAHVLSGVILIALATVPERSAASTGGGWTAILASTNEG